MADYRAGTFYEAFYGAGIVLRWMEAGMDF